MSGPIGSAAGCVVARGWPTLTCAEGGTEVTDGIVGAAGTLIPDDVGGVATGIWAAGAAAGSKAGVRGVAGATGITGATGAAVPGAVARAAAGNLASENLPFGIK
mmetsp:Transcript_24202/g.40016  ORF Transcript_24202/g.40016 Transcript_24202/m.40016 type:complete len:105 (-) Transcript_24202:34-348(-)